MQSAVPLACFLSVIRPFGVMFEDALFQIAPVDKAKCPFVRSSNDITFQLYTRKNPTEYQELVVGDDNRLALSNVDFHRDTVVFFHAFMETPNDGSGLMIREAYLLRDNVNMIMVDASRLEAGPWYFAAAENTWYIGRYVAELLDYMVSRGLDLSRTHLVGHSLGAQAAGVAGASLRTGRVSRITGLDPALPLFNKLGPQQRLDPSDADLVDVIHTDAGIFGVIDPVGHADFYPNGGISPQPGCELEVIIPQKLLLRKCNESEALHGFYTVHLSAQQTNRHFENTKKKPIKSIDNETQKPFAITQLNRRTKFKTQTLKATHKKRHVNIQSQQQKTLKTDRKLAKTEPTRTVQRHKRQKRFASFLTRNGITENGNLLLRTLEFLIKNRKSVVPVFTVMREISTWVKNGNGELTHYVKESNNIIGAKPPYNLPYTYTLESGGTESKIKSFLKRLFGLSPNGDRLTSTG